MFATAQISKATVTYQSGSRLWVVQGGCIVGEVHRIAGQYLLTLFNAGAGLFCQSFGSLMGVKLHIKKVLSL